MKVEEETIDRFVERAEAAAAKVTRVAGEAAAEKLASELQAADGSEHVGVVRVAKGIADTGTCVVVTDDEETRLKTMLPETTVFILRAEDVVPHLSDIAPFLRSRQAAGRVSYISFITGPSRTADIERVSAIGVHGPLAARIILVG
ncbi:MAG: LUD domain-containing protein [Kiritimatiellae bacterium]|nr:LUD domain-containing protein [Kiritimatiellia bacterium]